MVKGDIVGQIIAWEDGEMDDQQEIIFFQSLVDTGLAWQLQGCYGRRAMQLIRDGVVQLPTGKRMMN